MFGQDAKVEPQRGFLQSAAHYAGVAVTEPFKKAFSLLNALSNFSSRSFRSVNVAASQNLSLKDAWAVANAGSTKAFEDKGEQVFDPKKVQSAVEKYGQARVDAALKISSGMSLAEAFAASDDAGKAILSEYAQNPKDGLFNDALYDLKWAKYSWGRGVARNFGVDKVPYLNDFYSGINDAAFRFFADPTIVGSKIMSTFKVAKFSLETMIGTEKVAKVFANPGVVKFWDKYGALLNDLNKATEAKDLAKAAIARTELKRLAPEFGDDVIKELSSPAVGIKNATDARNWFENTKDLDLILKGQPARSTPLMPRLDAARRSKLALYTTADKIFNINKIGPDFLRTAYITDEGVNDIATGLVKDPELIAESVKQGLASTRYSFAQVQRRIDAFAAKWEKIPFSKNNALNVTDPGAVTQVYRIARLSLPRYQSKIIAEAFNLADVGTKKEIVHGLWYTVGAVRGVDKTEAGLKMLKNLIRPNDQAYSATIEVRDAAGNLLREYSPGLINDKPMAVGLWQLSDFVSMPSIQSMDQLAARSGITGRIMGFSHKKWVEKLTNNWSFLTLAGPRFPLRNGTEDLMFHLALGENPWGIAKGRWISTQMRLARQGHDVGMINKFVKASDRKYYGNAIRNIMESPKLSDAQKVSQMRGLLAETVAGSKIGRVLTGDEKAFLKEHITLGHIDGMLEDVSEGAKNLYKGVDSVTRALTLQKEVGPIAALKFDGEAYVRKMGKGGFGQFAPAAGTSEKVSWISLIHTWSKDELGKIAMPLLDGNGNTAAIAAVRDYLLEHPNVFAKFRMQANDLTESDVAQRTVDTVANLFSRKNGQLNQEFWAKVVTPDGIKAAGLTLDDLPQKLNDIPAMISGAVYIPVAEGGNIVPSLVDRGWDWMGEANARFTREPIVLNEMLRIRNELRGSGFEQEFIKRYTTNLDKKDIASATKKAKEALVALVEDRAVARTLAFVDNPAVRTQLALSSRNFARFYRATEDFFRRMSRVVRYNPAALQKAALTYEGIAHTGWVQKDENGESYFLYPGLPAVYTAMMGTLKLFGVESAFKIPQPVQFGGKLNMITPSLNPDSLMPTFAGPLGGVSVKVLGNIIGFWDKDQQTAFEKVFLGPYSQNQKMVNVLLPSHINRIYATLDREERDSQYASAFRKAVTYLEAAGHAPKPTKNPDGTFKPPSSGELEKYQDQLKSVTAAVLATRFVYGLFAPAAPQLDFKSDMSEWVRDSGVSSWRKAWVELLNKNGNDYDKAMTQWVKFFPDKVPYTVAENERKTKMLIQASQESSDFVLQNKKLFDDYPKGAPFLMPMNGEFTYEAFKTLKNNDLYVNASVGDFLKKVQTAGDYNFYFTQKQDYENKLRQTTNDAEKRAMRDKWSAWKTAYMGARPLLADRLAAGAMAKNEAEQTFEDLKLMVQDKTVAVRPKTRAALARMVGIYDQFKQVKDSNLSDYQKDQAKQALISQMEEMAYVNENAGAAYTALFKGLMGVED